MWNEYVHSYLGDFVLGLGRCIHGKHYETSLELFHKTEIALEVMSNPPPPRPLHPDPSQEGPGMHPGPSLPPGLLLAWAPGSPARLTGPCPLTVFLCSRVPFPQTGRGEAVACHAQSSGVENFLFNFSSQCLLHRYIINHISFLSFPPRYPASAGSKPPCPGI